ncbi:MAG: phage tail protein [Bacteroidia bacterium]
MATAYPMPVFHFEVDWGGTNLGFSEVSGLTRETQVIEYRDGLSKEYNVSKMPGIPKFGNITLKRGIVKGDANFKDWYNTIALNTVERRTITIKLLDEEHNPTVTWTVKNAFPVKMDGPGLKATGNEVAIETLEIAHEGLTVEFN